MRLLLYICLAAAAHAATKTHVVLHAPDAARARLSLRGHVDAVNHVCFRPFSNTVCTASGDKTASLWDVRSGLCTQTFYGHANAVNPAPSM